VALYLYSLWKHSWRGEGKNTFFFTFMSLNKKSTYQINFFTGMFAVLLLSSTLALPPRSSRVNTALTANNFVGEGTNELATAILQVLYTILKQDNRY
jgi:hypothetical protein